MIELSKQTRRELVANLRPEQPLDPGDDRYVELFGQAKGELSPVARALFQALDDADPRGRSTLLFTGFPGTGKTTELRRLQARLNADQETPTRALLVDGAEYIDLYATPHIADVLRVMAHELDRAATEAEGRDPDAADSYLARLWKFLVETDVDLTGFKAQAGTKEAHLQLMGEFRRNPSFISRVREALSDRLSGFVFEANASIIESVDRLRKAARVERVVVLFDSLEKISPVDPGRAESTELGLEQLFVRQAELLKVAAHVVYTFPLGLRFQHPGIDTRHSGPAEVQPMVGVRERDRSPKRQGMDRLRRLLQKRFGQHFDRCFPDPSVLDPMILASGGYPRDLLRMARGLIHRNREAPFGATQIAEIINEVAEQYGHVYRADQRALLQAVARTHAAPQDDDAAVRQFGRLVQRNIILAYRNGEEWFDVHPLLRDHSRHAPLFQLQD
ncbi:MAG: ATP-binding protein [Myxococcales bacterium]|nr:ATP-binding protein [Myxococcales bacterium]